MTNKYPLLFTPYQLGKYTLQSRIVVTGHAANFVDHNQLPTEKYAYYLRERARGGAGLVSIGETGVHPASDPTLPLNWDDSIIPRYRQIADLVHEFPVPVITQLSHGGRRAGVERRRYLKADWPTIAPSPVPMSAYGYVQVMPSEMSTGEVEDMVQAFGLAARRAKEGMLDGVEIVIGQSALVSQFLHPQSNRRTDKYGGQTLAERMTFLYEILSIVRQNLGTDLLLGVRINDDLVDYSIDYEDTKAMVPLLEATGLLDYVNIWVGFVLDEAASRAHWPPYYHEPGEFASRPAGIKRVTTLPVIGIGRINTPALAEQMLRENKMDLVGMVRELIADPHFPIKAKEGREDDIRMCIACSQSCAGRQESILPITCIYNPVTGNEQLWAETGTASERKKIVVIGGGPAGMEAARVAALRGHKVVLFEQSNRLGGQIRLAMTTPKRESFEEVIMFFETQLGKLDVDIRLDTEATLPTVLKETPDVAILATGSTPYIPEVIGASQTNVITAHDVLKGAHTGDTVVIIDTQGNPPGPTVAEFLADQGKKVEIITGLKWVGSEIKPAAVWHPLYERLLQKGVTLTPMTGVSRIGEDFIEVYNVVSPTITRIIESVDTVVFAAGGIANNTLYSKMKGKIPEIYPVGDCVQPRGIEIATYHAHKQAMDI